MCGEFGGYQWAMAFVTTDWTSLFLFSSLLMLLEFVLFLFTLCFILSSFLVTFLNPLCVILTLLLPFAHPFNVLPFLGAFYTFEKKTCPSTCNYEKEGTDSPHRQQLYTPTNPAVAK